VISPYAKINYVDHTVPIRARSIRFIEDNWLGGQRIGSGSFDAIAGPINSMFDFSFLHTAPLILNTSTGEPVTSSPIGPAAAK
jgi:phospholipase C